MQQKTKTCENKDFCSVVIPSRDTKKLELNQCKISDKAPFVIYADIECLIEYSTRFSMSTISSFKNIEHKHDLYRGKYCMKKFSEVLREHAMKTSNFQKKKMRLLTKL